MKNMVLCLMGPTAAGKTDLACRIVQELPVEIISVDSAMIYRDMNIGTAKPDLTILKQAPHYLIDVCDPIETFSAAKFCEAANLLIESIISRGNIPLLVGGTMLYYRALQQGLSTLPSADEQIRMQLTHDLKLHGNDYMHQLLASIDPKSALRIHSHDTQRIMRALEVYQITGQPLSQLLGNTHSDQYRFINLVLMPESRAWLHQRIAERFVYMLAQGLIAEVEYLIKKWSVTAEHTSMRSVGYRQVLNYLQGNDTKETLCDKGIAATRQLAKRQLTWLRSWPDAKVFFVDQGNVERDVLEYITQCSLLK